MLADGGGIDATPEAPRGVSSQQISFRGHEWSKGGSAGHILMQVRMRRGKIAVELRAVVRSCGSQDGRH